MLILLAIISSVVSVAVVIVQSVREKESTEKAERANQKLHDANEKIISLQQKTIKTTSNISELQNQLLKANETTLALQHQTITSTVEITELQKKLIEANDVVVKLQEENNKQLTGGDAKPDIRPTLPAGSPDAIQLDLINDADYPVTDVMVRVVNYTNEPDFSLLTPEERGRFIKERTTVINIGTMSKHIANVGIYGLKYGVDVKEIKLTFYVNWRNGHYWGNAIFERKQDHFEVKSFEKY